MIIQHLREVAMTFFTQRFKGADNGSIQPQQQPVRVDL
jgi:hypothetical protein